jgi:hypothetical protein
MRFRTLCLIVAGGVAAAGAARAQPGAMMVPQPPVQAYSPLPPMASRAELAAVNREVYGSRLRSLRAKTLKLKAQDGGELSAQHAANLQQELDKLNRTYGVKAG